MRGLEGRVARLETGRGDLRLAHLSDAEIKGRFNAVCSELEAFGAPLEPHWRDLVAAGAWGTLAHQAEELTGWIDAR